MAPWSSKPLGKALLAVTVPWVLCCARYDLGAGRDRRDYVAVLVLF
jgi:hypothetical protein